jgi:thymidylate synthase
MILNPDIKNLFDFTYDDFTLVDYVAEPNIKAPISV